jgi:CHAT domain-containing protein
MGDTFQAQGEIQDAVIAYEAALQALESPDQLKANSVIRGRTLAALGRSYLEQNRWEDARSYYQQAQELAKIENDREVLGYCYWGLGCCHQAAGELTAAIASLEESLKLIELRQQDLQTELSDRWSLIYSPSAQTLAEIRQEPCYATGEKSKVLVVGNPVMPKIVTEDGREIILEPLSGAEAEARSIASSLGNHQYTLLLQAAATETAVKDLTRTHNIIHLATHGIAYTEDPLASLVVFAPTATENGLLTAREVAQSRDLPVDLVVLSACQTGLGRVSGDGMLGLSRAFLIAGARTVVVSQWSVSDGATKELMVAFYQNYLASGNKAIALQLAMQKVRSIPEYAHPRFWAAFVMVGAEV